MKSIVGALAAAFLIGAAQADVWDGNDDQNSKPHDLAHGSDEAHDLGARPGAIPDVDWSRLPQDAYSSYEVTIDGVASQVETIELTRFDSTGTTLLQTAAAPNPVGGTSRVLEWKNGTTPEFGFVRVQGAACGSTCSKDAAYRIRAVETTIAISRFDNTGTWQTNLFVQNLRPTTRSVTAYFWYASGSLMSTATTTFSVPAHGWVRLPTFLVAAGQYGSITLGHDAGYGGLTAKAITTDTATGINYDTPGSYRPR